MEIPVKIAPPAELLRQCHTPVFSGATNGALVEYIQALIAALEACNADKAQLEEFFRL